MRYSFAACAVVMAGSAAALPWDLDWSDLAGDVLQRVKVGHEPEAAPVVVDDMGSHTTETISPEDLNKIQYYAEVAAAAYCEIQIEEPVYLGFDNETNSTSSAFPLEGVVTCKDNICPNVEANRLSRIHDFANGDMDTTGFVGVDYFQQEVIIAYRGSKSVENWIANMMVEQVDLEADWQECKGCKVHSGFERAFYEEMEMFDVVQSFMGLHPDFRITVVGHSLGGALAMLAAAHLRHMGHTVDLFTYGQPKVGNKEFSDYISNSGVNYRVTHTDDPVPNILPEIMDYHHVYPEYHIFKDAPLEVAITPADVHVHRSLAESCRSGSNDFSLMNLNFDSHRAYLLPVGISSCTPREPIGNIFEKIWKSLTRKV